MDGEYGAFRQVREQRLRNPSYTTPVTPLYKRMKAADRLVTSDWERSDTRHIVFRHSSADTVPA